MSIEAIVSIAVVTAALLGFFVWFSEHELRKGAEKNPRAAHFPPPEPPEPPADASGGPWLPFHKHRHP